MQLSLCLVICVAKPFPSLLFVFISLWCLLMKRSYFTWLKSSIFFLYGLQTVSIQKSFLFQIINVPSFSFFQKLENFAFHI